MSKISERQKQFSEQGRKNFDQIVWEPREKDSPTSKDVQRRNEDPWRNHRSEALAIDPRDIPERRKEDAKIGKTHINYDAWGRPGGFTSNRDKAEYAAARGCFFKNAYY